MDLDLINKRGQQLRAKLFAPIFPILTKLGFTPMRLTCLRLIGGVVFVFMLPKAPKTAFIILMLAALLDWIDGGLARYQQVASDRGKFWDVLVDHTNYVLAVFAFIRLGVFSPVILSYHLVIVPILYLLATIKESEHRKTDWIIYPFYAIVYFKPVGILVAFLYIWFEINQVNLVIALLNAVMTLFAVRFAIELHQRWKKQS